jgi:hypothetical protein
VFALVGGKLTTYRAMAEEAVDKVEAALGLVAALQHAPPPAGPGRAAVNPPNSACPHLAELAPRHGPFARELAARIARDPALGRAAGPRSPVPLGRGRPRDRLPRAASTSRTSCAAASRSPSPRPSSACSVARLVAERLVDAWGGTSRDVDLELERYRDVMRQETGRVLAPC